MQNNRFSEILKTLPLSVMMILLLSVMQIVPFDSNSLSQEAGTSGSEEIKQGTVITDVKISGNKRVEKELIQINLDSKAGDVFSFETVRRDIETVYGLGYFENVTVEYEKDEEGITLFYIVDEKPVVVDLRVSGNDDIKDEDVQEVIKVGEGKIVDIRDIVASKEAIEDLYAQKGFVGTEVSYEIEPLDVGTIGVRYDIKEGETAYIKKVEIKGNEELDDDYLKERIYSKPKGFFSFLSKKGLYNIEEIRRDSERIRAFYLDNGFLDANVSSPDISYVEEEEGYKVVFTVEEGEQYKLAEINFGGELIADRQELLDVMELRPGDIFSSIKLSNDISNLTTFYGDRGFAFANVNPDINVDNENLLVDVFLELEKSNKVYIRHIDILGNYRTRDKVVRRELSLQEQEPYSASEIKDIKRQVTRLGYFENNVEVNTKRVPDSDDELDVDVKVEEKPTGFFSVAGGFSSVEKILFAGQVQESNLFGYGKKLSLNAQIGGVTQLFSLNYQDLYFLDTDYTFDLSLFKNDREFRDFDRDSYGFNVGVGKRIIYDDLRFRVSYRWESTDIQDVDRDARLIITESKRKISSLSFGLIWDGRNNFIDPTSGNLTRTFIEYAGPLGGDTDFIKYTASSTQWIPFWRSTYFQMSGEYGIIDLEDTGNDLVVGERFFLGGPNSLRGFAFRRVGPRVPTEDGGFVIIGGVQQLLFSVDYIFPLLSGAGLKGVVFFDIGDVFNDGEDLTFNPADLRRDVGLGIRWISPLGPLRLEVGFPVGDRLPGEDPFEIQFTVGSLF